ncbi:MAG: bifunctional serine/threonine-protein kinase/formylglycine-generating enzyme family protein [Planctomycetota bacterium]
MNTPHPPEPGLDDPHEPILAELLERGEDPEFDGRAWLERHHPDRAGEVLRRLGILERLGLGRLPEGGGDAVDRRFGDFRLERLLGRGGMGDVYLARQISLDRPVALKLLRGAAVLGAAARERFLREALAAARLNHPHIVTVHATGAEDGIPFIAMEYVEGWSLDALLRGAADRPRPALRELVTWGRDIALALEAAHAAGLVHRDVKPSNVQVSRDGRAVLLDFGLTHDEAAATLSLAGSFLGSPHYAAPGRSEATGTRSARPPTSTDSARPCTRRSPGDLPSPRPRPSGSSTTCSPASPRRSAGRIPRSRVIWSASSPARSRSAPSTATSARAMADDLQAVLELRDVTARPPRFARRAARWCARRPALSAGVATLLVLSAVGLGLVAAGERRDREERERRAADLVRRSEVRLADFVREVSELPRRASELEKLRLNSERRPRAFALVARLDREERELARIRADQSTVSLEILQNLRDADRLGGDRRETARLRARVYLELWRLARSEGRRGARLPRRAGPRERPRRRGLARAGARDLLPRRDRPAGARVDLFLLRHLDDLVSGSSPRIVPVPLRGGPPGLEPGREVLRLAVGSGEFRAEDLLLELDGRPIAGAILVAAAGRGLERLDRFVGLDDEVPRDLGDLEALAVAADGRRPRRFRFERRGGGELVLEAADLAELGVPLADARGIAAAGGVRARLWRDGVARDVELPPGLTWRHTASPLYHGESSYAGRTPLRVDLAAEQVLALVRHEGREPVRLLYPNPHLEGRVDPVPLVAEGRHPPEFRRVLLHNGRLHRVMDREVTCAEYLEFLRDPAVGPGARDAGLVPADEVSWMRDATGAWSLGPGLRPDLPVSGLSWNAGRAYAAWRTERARAAGRPWTFDYPHRETHLQLANPGGLLRRFVWGDAFRPHYAKSCFARARPGLEPGLRFPVDETVTGLFDLAGGVSEFCRGWFWEERGERPVGGGNWAYAEPQRFGANYLFGLMPDRNWEITGFRLELDDEAERDAPR